ncbi:YsnF/AvaK domain-containing protein [Cesiribacter andamanensis]|uniref:DUF2382 domain-containing protein n=1 Tax=Cesiribacter andamanensis AMV16 TaxID=1279009 RepID=M7N4G5_9BACT|nr:YsnF/AvaK domain-containing protein [Cesiribacter andamanensis]EMR03563.1 hypothetical protein ADICEAN_01330 [Cesiribacter andamanensis AMV16]
MRHSVVALFDKPDQAQDAVQALLNQGIKREHIDVHARRASADKDDDHSSIGNFFRNLFGSSDDATNHTEVARRNSVVTVHAQDKREAQQAAAILDQFGALDANEHAARYRSGNQAGSQGTDKTIPIIEENVEVGKKEVTTGGVRLRSRIIEKPIEETLRLREEHVHVDRRPVDRPASQRDFDSFKEGSSKVVEHAEVPLVNKESRVVEEVRVGKESSTHKETIHETARKTDVDVDKIKSDKHIDSKRDLDRDRGRDL